MIDTILLLLILLVLLNINSKLPRRDLIKEAAERDEAKKEQFRRDLADRLRSEAQSEKD